MDRERLKRDVERIETHRKEKAAVAKSEREIFAKLKEDGFNCKVVREIFKRRGMDDSDGWDAEVATYEAAVKGLREAAEAVRSGATYEEAATTHNVRKADLHHFVQATGDVPETDVLEHDADGVVIEVPPVATQTEREEPNAGLSSSTESCGGAVTTRAEVPPASIPRLDEASAPLKCRAPQDLIKEVAHDRGLAPEPEVARVVPPATDPVDWDSIIASQPTQLRGRAAQTSQLDTK